MIFSSLVYIIFVQNILQLKSISKQSELSQKEVLTIAVAPLQSATLLYIALENGYFDDEGLILKTRNLYTGRDNIIDMSSGKSDLAVSCEYPFIKLASTNQNLRIISSLHRTEKGAAVVARRSRVKDLYDLRGKTIAYIPGTVTEYVLDQVLFAAGLTRSDIKIVAADRATLESGLLYGQFDAVTVYEPSIFMLKNEIGKENTTVLYSEKYIENSLIVGDKNRLEAKKETIEKFLRALARAEVFYNNSPNKEVVVGFLSKSLPQNSREQILYLYNLYKPTLIMDNTLIQLLKTEAQDANIYGMKFRDLISEQYMKEVAPSNVRFFDDN